MLPRDTTTEAPFPQAMAPMEAFEYCSSHVIERFSQAPVSSLADPNNHCYIHSNSLPNPLPCLQTYEEPIVPSISSLPSIYLDGFHPQQFVVPHGPFQKGSVPVVDKMPNGPHVTRSPQFVSSTEGFPLFHATSSANPGPIVSLSSSFTIDSQSPIDSLRPNHMKHRTATEHYIAGEPREKCPRSPNVPTYKALFNFDEKIPIQDKSSICTIEEPLDLSMKTRQTLDRPPFFRNETRPTLKVSQSECSSHDANSSIANYERCTRHNIKTIAKCYSNIVAAARIAKVYENDMGMMTSDRTFTNTGGKHLGDEREAMELPPRQTKQQVEHVDREINTEDMKGSDLCTRSGIQFTRFSSHDQNNHGEPNGLSKGKRSQLSSFFLSSGPSTHESGKFYPLKMDDNHTKVHQTSAQYDKQLSKDNLKHGKTQLVKSSNYQMTFDLREEKGEKIAQRKNSNEPINSRRLPFGRKIKESEPNNASTLGRNMEEDEDKDEKCNFGFSNDELEMKQEKISCSMNLKDHSRRINVRESVNRQEVTKSVGKTMSDDTSKSVKSLSIPLIDVSKLLKGARNGPENSIKETERTDTYDKVTRFKDGLNVKGKPFSDLVVLKKDGKNKWTVIRSARRKGKSIAMVNPSVRKSKRLFKHLNNDEGLRNVRDATSSFEKGDNEVVNKVRVSQFSSAVESDALPNSSKEELKILATTDSESSTPQKMTTGSTLSVSMETTKKPSNFSHLSAKEKVRFLRTRIVSSEREVAKIRSSEKQ